MGKRKLTFEEALTELEAIAGRIEQGKIGLEESIDQYERGMALVKQCRDILSKAEQRIRKLEPKPDGTLGTEPFHAETDGEA